MEPKVTRIAMVNMDESMTPASLQRALGLLFDQAVPGDAGLRVSISDTFRGGFKLRAEWDAPVPAATDETETGAADDHCGESGDNGRPYCDRVVEHGECPVHGPVGPDPAERVERIPLEDVKITESTEDSVTIMATLPDKLQAAMAQNLSRGFSFIRPEPDRSAIADNLKRSWDM